MEDAEIDTSERRLLVVQGPEARALAERSGMTLFLCPWGEETFLASLTDDELSDKRNEWAERFADDSELEQYLIQAGVPGFGVDYSASDNPHDASLERRTVDWSKGCYLGQEVVCMQDMRGKVKRRLVRVVAKNGRQLTAGTEVSAEGQAVGRITSSVGSSGIASIKSPYFEPGSAVTAEGVELEVEHLV
jgi:folate-binding protein YgfZ